MADWNKNFLPCFLSRTRRGRGNAHGPSFGDLGKLARILVFVKKMSLNNFQNVEAAAGSGTIPGVSEEMRLTQGVLALGRAGHRIAASRVIKIPQFLALEIGLDRRRAISANLLNSE